MHMSHLGRWGVVAVGCFLRHSTILLVLDSTGVCGLIMIHLGCCLCGQWEKGGRKGIQLGGQLVAVTEIQVVSIILIN